MSDFVLDLRYALRALRRASGYAAASLLKRAADPLLPIGAVQSLDGLERGTTAVPRFRSTLLGPFALAALLAAVAAAANCLPARRASRLDPVEALRHE